MIPKVADFLDKLIATRQRECDHERNLLKRSWARKLAGRGFLQPDLRRRSAGPTKRFDTGQKLALKPFEKGAAGCRDISEVLRDIGLIEGRDGVAAAGDRIQCADLGELRRDLGDRHRAGLERRHLESADGSVPDE